MPPPAQVAAQFDPSEEAGDLVPPPEVIRREGIATIRVYLSSEEGMFGEAEDVLLAVDSFDLEGRRVRHESPVLNRSVTTWRWTTEGEPEEVVKRRRGARVGDTTVTRTQYEYGPTEIGTGPRRLLRDTQMVPSGTSEIKPDFRLPIADFQMGECGNGEMDEKLNSFSYTLRSFLTSSFENLKSAIENRVTGGVASSSIRSWLHGLRAE